eukprot:TRINITY_DN14600_c0_g1_i1.p1 TRINITY_DN14600_c0_g1~~TRINITY_DN14600_c0_g1_i1.p1  ORF type:complete len:533 (-),score=48.51 TRINITY_DN14600_c0_g1_i1:82-1680(-)
MQHHFFSNVDTSFLIISLASFALLTCYIFSKLQVRKNSVQPDPSGTSVSVQSFSSETGLVRRRNGARATEDESKGKLDSHEGISRAVTSSERVVNSARVEKKGFACPTRGGDLWRWRWLATRRLVGRYVEAPVTANAIRRRICCFLDDRPRYVASGCVDGQARIFDVLSGRQIVSVRHDPGARDAVNSLYMSAVGPSLITGTWDGKWHRWESWPQRPGRASELARGEQGIGHENQVSGFALSRDGNKVAVACTVGRVLLFCGNCPTTEVIVTDQEDLLRLRDVVKLGDYGEFYLLEDVELGGVVVEKNDQLLFEAAFAGKSSRKDIPALDLPAHLRFRFRGCLTHGHKKAWRSLEHDGAVKALVISAEGSAEYLYSGSRDRLVKKWSLLDGSCVHAYTGHTSMVRCLAVNSKYLVSGGDDRAVLVWRKQEPELIRTIKGHSDFVRSVALCPNLTERLVSAGDDKRVILWDADMGLRLFDFPHHQTVPAVVLLNASLLLSAGEDGRLRVWNVEDGELKSQMRHPGSVTALSWM